MAQSKITTRDALIPKLSGLRAANKRIGYTSGVFDILHRGHVEYLDAARAACDFLCVGVNSDQSVRLNKGEGRPIVTAAERARVIAALFSVDAVFIFDETNNQSNINALKPDLYIKAGDYQAKGLSSASLVESYGGKVLFVPFEAGHSSSGIISRIEQGALQGMHKEGSAPPLERRPAVFLDRDGTINVNEGYLGDPSKMRAYPGALEAIKAIRLKGYRVIIVTNQPGIGFGYFSREDFFAVNHVLLKEAGKVGALFDGVYFCPHTQAAGCSCRKPGTQLIERAVTDHNIDLSNSFVVGDQSSDVQLAHNVRCRSILVKTGHGGADGKFSAVPELVVDSIAHVPSLLPKLSAQCD
jgi:rfaE bifunctional protein nucleotidyltransferase chain/domain